MVSAGGGDARLQGAPRPPPGRQPRPGHPAPVQPAAGAGAAQPADNLSGAAKIVGSLVKLQTKVREDFTIMEKTPPGFFSRLKALSHLIHYA